QGRGRRLDGITEHVDHIDALGADTLYLTPFFPAAVRVNAHDAFWSEVGQSRMVRPVSRGGPPASNKHVVTRSGRAQGRSAAWAMAQMWSILSGAPAAATGRPGRRWSTGTPRWCGECAADAGWPPRMPRTCSRAS